MERTIEVIVERLVAQFAPERIILFGSHSRGEATPHSDVDLLVVVQVADKHQAAVEMRRTLRGLGVAKDVVVATPDEIERRGDLVGTVLRPALQEGKELYVRS